MVKTLDIKNRDQVEKINELATHTPYEVWQRTASIPEAWTGWSTRWPEPPSEKRSPGVPCCRAERRGPFVRRPCAKFYKISQIFA